MVKKKKKVKKGKTGKKPISLLKTLGYLNEAYAAGAVIAVFRENQANVAFSQFEASADPWTMNSTLRADLFNRAVAAWGRLTDKDFTWFPYSEDYVARLYLRLRKVNKTTLKAWEDETKEALLYAPGKSQV